MSARDKKHRGKSTSAATKPAEKKLARVNWMGRPLVILLALGAFAGTWALLELVIWNKVPSELVGKWVIVDTGPQKGATFDFSRGGTMVGTVNVRGEAHLIKAKIRVEGKNIFSTTHHPKTGDEKTTVLVIRTLTATELVVEDEQGMLMKMERAE